MVCAGAAGVRCWLPKAVWLETPASVVAAVACGGVVGCDALTNPCAFVLS